MIRSEYFDRELSWVAFNARVLSEGLQKKNPLLERLNFLCIVSSNFDEFFMVRVASLRNAIAGGKTGRTPSGLGLEELLKKTLTAVRTVVEGQYTCFRDEIHPGLAEHGVVQLSIPELDRRQTEFVTTLFEKQIFPVLSPVRVFPGKPLPNIGSLRLRILFRLIPTAGLSKSKLEMTAGNESLYAILPIPHNMDRIVWVPDGEDRACFVLLEDIIINQAGHLFSGFKIEDSVLFRITRDADLGVDEERDEDFMDAMEEVLADRQHSLPVRLEVRGKDNSLKGFLLERLHLTDDDLFEILGPVDLTSFSALTSLKGKDDLRNPPWPPVQPPRVAEAGDIFSVIDRTDILLHHPYDSFDPVIRFLSEAAVDPEVLAVKMTLYRTSGRSGIVRALTKAAENGKQVVVLVELKARFDEERNIGWAQSLEKAGAIVVYGIANLKVHAKALLVVRRGEKGIRRYVHLSTGNYNDSTARLYTDIGLLTSDETLTYETALFFNVITGYSSIPTLSKLVIAPLSLKERVMELIAREAAKSTPGNPGLIMAKMNSLTDLDVIDALYQASQGGVRIDLNVRGVCMLVPARTGLSEKIRVVSIVGRFLEHSRIFYFSNGGEEEVYLSSADLMPRNLEKRIELMFPVEQSGPKSLVIDALTAFFQDNVNAHVLETDGEYRRRKPGRNEPVFRSQEELYKNAGERAGDNSKKQEKEFVVRRKPPESI